jgi:hypothetical protein
MGDLKGTVEEMRGLALRMMLVLAFANALVLSAVALATTESRHALGGVAFAAASALTIALFPLARRERLARDLEVPWVAVTAGILGAVALTLGATSRSIMFAAFLTPVGVCVLFDRWGQAFAVTALLIAGYAAASATSKLHGGLGVALSDIAPSLAVIAGGLIPAHLALRVIEARQSMVEVWRNGGTTPGRLRPGRPGMASEHDAEILAALLGGKRYGAIAHELGITTTSVRDRAKSLVAAHDVRNVPELVRLLQHKALEEATL